LWLISHPFLRSRTWIRRYSYLHPRKPGKLEALRTLWASYGLDGPHEARDAYSVNHPATAEWSDETFWTFLHAYHDVVDLANPVASVSDLADAIDHAVAVIGIDHVGISSDFNHGGGVIGWMGADETLNVTAELLRRGYGEHDLAKLWGASFMRVWQDVLNLGRSEGRT
jgi:microsomal dipeptidase-like Zn-dependent dipeptidase